MGKGRHQRIHGISRWSGMDCEREWRGDSIHYLDDYLMIGAPASGECKKFLQLFENTCTRLGVPLATDKREWPVCQLAFLGILFDSVRMELRLPQENFCGTLSLVSEWQQRKSCIKKELLSLIGHLQHATRIVKQGRPFLRRMIDLSPLCQSCNTTFDSGGFKSGGLCSSNDGTGLA